eukprot:TRINITY_DN2653_c0_g1_i1.p1 TRINITY_DN2653_c0_g1~~TRINITY_DN2653_c0_g1_i1.p1  ORF type:complete len:617 (-),score=158.66 TRINITY_DN2653_c0_g1_i1:183-1826(-)
MGIGSVGDRLKLLRLSNAPKHSPPITPPRAKGNTLKSPISSPPASNGSPVLSPNSGPLRSRNSQLVSPVARASIETSSPSRSPIDTSPNWRGSADPAWSRANPDPSTSSSDSSILGEGHRQRSKTSATAAALNNVIQSHMRPQDQNFNLNSQVENSNSEMAVCRICSVEIVGAMITIRSHKFHLKCFKCERCNNALQPQQQYLLLGKSFYHHSCLSCSFCKSQLGTLEFYVYQGNYCCETCRPIHLPNDAPTSQDLPTSPPDTSPTAPTGPWGYLMPQKSELQLPSSIELKNENFWVGRGQTADLRIENGVVSALHCRIYKENDGKDRYYVEDNSTNGTYVNSVLVGKGNRTEVFKDDEISFACSTDVHTGTFKRQKMTLKIVEVNRPKKWKQLEENPTTRGRIEKQSTLRTLRHNIMMKVKPTETSSSAVTYRDADGRSEGKPVRNKERGMSVFWDRKDGGDARSTLRSLMSTIGNKSSGELPTSPEGSRQKLQEQKTYLKRHIEDETHNNVQYRSKIIELEAQVQRFMEEKKALLKYTEHLERSQ